jgi:phage terminase Nu1 subunit (DNA packaging protein)
MTLKDVGATKSGKKRRAKSGKSGIRSAEDDVTRDFLARVFGCDIRTITNKAAAGMPKSARGKFPLAACVRWTLEHERELARAGKGLNDLDLARQRKTIAEARIAEIDLSEREGTSIPIEVHKERLRTRLETVAGQVKAIGRYQSEIKSAITDQQADALLDRMSDGILAELYGLKDEIE